MDFVPTLPTFASDVTAQTVWKWFEQRLAGEDGVAFYKYPNVGGPNTPQPDLTIVTRSYHPIIIKCSDIQIDQLIEIGADSWTVANGADGEIIDSPLLETEDIAVAMQEKFDRERPLRHALKVKNILALPLMDRHEFERRFGEQHAILWDELGTVRWLQRFASPLENDQWRLVQSVVQAAVPLSRFTGAHLRKPPATFGDALKILENNIALLDMEQQRAATQIPPGPQRIRGLAGTGKTVLLALKAANIHRQFPDATILFTFNTCDLYAVLEVASRVLSAASRWRDLIVTLFTTALRRKECHVFAFLSLENTRLDSRHGASDSFSSGYRRCCANRPDRRSCQSRGKHVQSSACAGHDPRPNS